MHEFKLPSLGADMDKGKLVSWLVKEGDRVKKGDVIAVVETQKSAVDVEVWQDGTVEKILVQPSEADLPVGTVLALLGGDGEAAAPPAEAVPKKAPAAATRPAVAARPLPPTVPGERAKISPAARRRAEEFRLDLAKLRGSGPEGAVVLEDVEAAIAAQTPAAGLPASGAQDKQLAMRRAIAAAMEKSHREIPLYFLETLIPMERALSWMEARNRDRPPNERLLYVALLLKAVALALREVPEFNGYYLNGAFQPGPGIHLGVAVSLREGGLQAPAIHDVDQKDLSRIMAEAQGLVKRVRGGGLKGSELTDPTITVTSLGEEGVEKVFGLIYPPQVAIVGFGKVYQAPLVEEGQVVARRAITAVLSADHRANDGHRGALFLKAIQRRLQEPEKL
ncbi:MAG: 2-oxo acid dehydrogenase subunit E2 [Deltaproteobacteria bacterium]|nr:2-oxo acid dehydrogenase subunit E2 [Deltaproteobacteria bacterium]